MMSLLPFKLALQPGETREIEVSPAIDVCFRLRRVSLSGVRRQYEIVRHGRKGWKNELVVSGPPVEILNVKVDNRDAMAPFPVPAIWFTAAAASPAAFNDRRAASVFTLVVRSLSDRPYLLRGALVGEVVQP